MRAKTWVAIGCLVAGVAVLLGAFGAHALKARFDAEQLENWRTAVRYQMWHGLALVAYGLWRRDGAGKAFPGWLFLVGPVFFSGSIYCLCFGLLRPVMGPVTPLGGSFLLAAWVSFAGQVIRRDS